MTMKVLERKIQRIERDVSSLRAQVKRAIPKEAIAEVLERTHGIVSEARGRALLKALDEQRKNWD